MGDSCAIAEHNDETYLLHGVEMLLERVKSKVNLSIEIWFSIVCCYSMGAARGRFSINGFWVLENDKIVESALTKPLSYPYTTLDSTAYNVAVADRKSFAKSFSVWTLQIPMHD